MFILSLNLAAGCAPQSPGFQSRVSRGIYHTVRPGENLFRIGKAYDVSHEVLARVNRLRDADQIRPGQRIFIPGAVRPLPVDVITPAAPATADTAEAVARNFLWPISGTINSGFGPRGSSFHDGIDIAAPEGTPIHAIADGEVIYSDQLRGYGNIVIVRHDDNIISVYAHNKTNLVREGQRVARGDVLARVGSTGKVTGPHLHFEIRRNNAAQDPLRYLPQLCCLSGSNVVAPQG